MDHKQSRASLGGAGTRIFLTMPAVSKAQQHLFGAALAHKRGQGGASAEAKRLADSMDEETLKHYAGTSTKNLPETKKASPRWVKMLATLSPVSKSRLQTSLPAGATRQLGKKMLGDGAEVRVFPGFTGQHGPSAIKMPALIDGMIDAPHLEKALRFSLSEKSRLMAKYPTIFAKPLHSVGGGGQVFERLKPIDILSHTLLNDFYSRLRRIGGDLPKRWKETLPVMKTPRLPGKLHLPWRTLSDINDRNMMLNSAGKMVISDFSKAPTVPRVLWGYLKDKLLTKKSSFWEKARAQLPGFHPYEAAAGGLAGAGAAGLYNWLSDDPEEENEMGRKGRNLVIGALAGAGGANLVGDRARRYISNVVHPAGYSADKVMSGIKDNGWRGAWKGGVLDQPLWGDKGNSTDYIMDMRRELFRRGLGVHGESAGDFFQTSRGNEVGLHPRLFNEAGNVQPQVWNALYGVANKPSDSALPVHLRRSPVLGGFTARRSPDQVNVSDVWDFSLNPKEKDLMLASAKHKFLGGAAPPPAALRDGISIHNDSSSDGMLSSLALRELASKVLMHNPTTFNQSFRLAPGDMGAKL